MNNNKFDYLIPGLSKKLQHAFSDIVSSYPTIFNNDVDTAPLVNMILGVFISSLLNILNGIKNNTVGEIKLINNIELTEKALIKLFKDLPFVKDVIIK